MADAPDKYRIEQVSGGFEAQMLYQLGGRSGDAWHPLNPDGFWSDPDGYSFGLITKRHVFATREEANLAILRAKEIANG